jgi:hypothetical protein
MFTTTLRISDELASFLQEAAKRQALSINAFLTRVLEARLEEERRQRLARDWALYAQDPSAQDVDFALPAQAELAAEPRLPNSEAPSPKKRKKKK